MSLNEKDGGVAAGLTITRPQPTLTESKRNDHLPTIEDLDSLHSITPTLTPTVTRGDEQESPSFVPFYSHPTTRTSLDAKKSESKTHIHQYDSDIEACLTDSHTNVLHPSLTKKTTGGCSVWPGQQELKEQRRQEKLRRKHCLNPMKNLDKRTKIYVKILIALLVVGLATGVGVGISKAVGGGVFKTNSTTTKIPS